ncbi:MAG: hypothetical protein IJ338_05715 [Bacteroidaceae bacterium]|nr:hypothetical protein [Bacteroidaceae bacterium]
MLITTQHPICDYRLFVSQSYKISKPYFSSSDPNEFIRYFGAMKKRHVYRNFYCCGENNFCGADHALKIIRNEPDRIASLRFRNEENRFYSDGYVLCKFENKSSYVIQDGGDKTNFIFDTLQYHLNLTAGINNTCGGFQYVSLSKAGKQLAQLYLKASSKYNALDRIHNYWISKGNPICMIELFENEISSNGLYDCFNRLEAVNGVWDDFIKLYYTNYQGIPCWVIRRENGGSEAFRFCLNLRTALLRIHAEKQTLIQALKFLSQNQDNSNVDNEKVISYLKKSLNKLLKGERFDIEQSPIVNMAFKIDDSFSQKEYQGLCEIIKDINNKYVIDDFHSLFAQIKFDELLVKIQTIPQIDLTSPEVQQVVRMVEKKDRLGLKKFINRNFSSLQNAAIYDVIKWAFVSSLSAFI